MKPFLANKYTQLLIATCLAIVFILAALLKIKNPSSFAFDLAQYQLFPFWAINPMAIIIPWVEFIFGFMIFFGAWRRSAALGMAVMSLIFMSAIGSALLRGLDFDCGCFGGQSLYAGMDTLIMDMLIAGGTLVLICVTPKPFHSKDTSHVIRTN